MKCDILFKLFTIIFSIFFCISPVFANTISDNILSKIIIEKSDNNSYKLHLLFDKKFTGNAFIQKGRSGSYFVYIPETIIQENKIKVAYKNRKDKSNIKIDIEEKPFLKENLQSNYIRISLKLKNDYSIKLLASTINKENNNFLLTSYKKSSIVLILLIACLLYLAIKLYKLTQTNLQNSYTTFHTNYTKTKQKLQENNFEKEINTRQTTLPKVNINKALRTKESNSFSCFDLPLVDENKISKYEFNSMLKQTSNMLKEKAAKSKHSNPISKNYIEDSSELDIPVVEEINKTEVINEEKTSTPELMSELHITPTKGFYLTTMDDSFALFGYVGEKIFLLQKFNDLTQINLQARFYDRNTNSDLYIVRLDSYKAMVEISDEGMKELAVL